MKRLLVVQACSKCSLHKLVFSSKQVKKENTVYLHGVIMEICHQDFTLVIHSNKVGACTNTNRKQEENDL